MHTIKQLFILVALSIYNAICVVTGGTSLKKLVPTGVIQQGILGGFSGKVGPVVGGKWKDIDYMRSYVIPSNPNTVNQQTVRTKFSALVSIARDLLSSLLQPFWDIYYTDMSGFNAWISENYDLVDGQNLLTDSNVMTKGTLEGVTGLGATYTTGSGAVAITWTENTNGNALGTDTGLVVIVDRPTNEILAILPSFETRATETGNTTVVSGLSATSILVYMSFFRGTGANLIVSDSVCVACTAP